MQNKNSIRSLMCSALSLPVGFLVGKLLEYILKSSNPAHINISGSLAYLGIILITSIIIVVAFWLTALIFALRGRANNEDKNANNTAFITLITIILVTFGVLIVSNATNKMIDDYKQAHPPSLIM